ncbi:MAG TPA: DUF1622 domain-containing protein [Coleofasciculaceae cyanobacterium]
MEWFQVLERSLFSVVTLTKFTLEAISVFCIIVGLFKTTQVALRLRYSRTGKLFPFNEVRLSFGMWLALALEFQLGADILATTIAPSFDSLGRLALIALIRTFLNYFLGHELETYYRAEKERQKGLAIRANEIDQSASPEELDA